MQTVPNCSDSVAPTELQRAAPLRVVTSTELLGAGRELRIEHQGEQYTLRLTRLGKLILTK